jgi:hypothetical protein
VGKRTMKGIVALAGGVAALAVAAAPVMAGGLPVRQPDGQIKTAESGSFTGVGDYLFSGPTYGSTQNAGGPIGDGFKQVFNYKVENDGVVRDQYRLTGGKGDFNFRVAYFKGQNNVSKPIKAGTYKTPKLNPNQSLNLRIVVTGLNNVEGVFFFPLIATSVKDASAIDIVRFGATNL